MLLHSYNEVYLMNGAVDVVEAKMLLVEAGEKLKAEMFPGSIRLYKTEKENSNAAERLDRQT
jgi:hypothetical protein